MKTVKIFFITEFGDIYKELKSTILNAIAYLNSKGNYQIEMLTVDNLSLNNVAGGVLRLIQEADIVISNVSKDSAHTLYEVGISHALNKPTILLVDNETQPAFDIQNYRFLIYDSKNISAGISDTLARFIADAIENPSEWLGDAKTRAISCDHKTVFVSYSHKDIAYLERLRVHLKPLERKSLIQLWSDTVIQSGEKWKREIEKALGKSAIAVLLISADFLASDFIVDNELQPLLKSAEQKGTIILPLILKPCRFMREPSISQFQAINNPSKPLCMLTEYEQEDIYERLSHRIEIAVKSET